MKINGRFIASRILANLKSETERNCINPSLAIIIVGQDRASLNYIANKRKFGKNIHVPVHIHQLPSNIKKRTLFDLVTKLNYDESIYGIIIQRPTPINIKEEELVNIVVPEKDVDGFRNDSLFEPPLALAIEIILKEIFQKNHKINKIMGNKSYLVWLSKKRILIIGRGVTGGKPIMKYFNKINIRFNHANSQTRNLKELCLNNEIIISCVGKKNIVRHDMVTDKSIVIGVGIHEENGRFYSDFTEKDIEKKAAFYTSIPGGVGHVNVASLFSNVILAYKYKHKTI
jgi:methylenetetrahydrofolate dehydrogenase (NADP+) / methenyltetrahydrofolate cyclohydrolase